MSDKTKTSLSWGKPKIEICELDDFGNMPTNPTWKPVPTPVEDSTQLVPTKGDKKEAKVEGGVNIAVKYKKNTYVLDFELYAEKGLDKPVEDYDGVIPGEYVVRLTPEDPTNAGIQIDRCVLSTEETFSAADGKKWKYSAEVLVPNDDSEQIKPYYANAVTATPTELYFTSEGPAQTVTVSGNKNVTNATSSAEWCTVTRNAKVVTVTAAKNTTTEVRKANVTIFVDGSRCVIPVTQLKA